MMQKRCILLLILPAAILSIGIAPALAAGSAIETQYTLPEQVVFTETVEAAGIFTETCKQELRFAAPVYATQIFVSEGDTVCKGQLLAAVDPQMTKAVVQQSVTVPKTTARADLAVLAQKYGINPKEAEAYLKENDLSVDSTVEEFVPRELRAPMDGIITNVGFQPYVLAAAGTPLLSVSDMDQLSARLKVLEEEISHIAIGNRVQLTSPTTEQSIYGNISKIYPTAQEDLATGERFVEVEVQLWNGANQLKPGSSANGSIEIGGSREIISIPYEAIAQDSNQQEYVYLYQKGRAVRRNIQTGQELLYTVEIIDGISASDIVLLFPDDLHDNALVRLKGDYSVA